MSQDELERLKTMIQHEDSLDAPHITEVKSEVRTGETFQFDDAIKRARLGDD